MTDPPTEENKPPTEEKPATMSDEMQEAAERGAAAATGSTTGVTTRSKSPASTATSKPAVSSPNPSFHTATKQNIEESERSLTSHSTGGIEESKTTSSGRRLTIDSTTGPTSVRERSERPRPPQSSSKKAKPYTTFVPLTRIVVHFVIDNMFIPKERLTYTCNLGDLVTGGAIHRFVDGTIAYPIPIAEARKSAPDGVINILRSQWSNLVKADGTRKARMCLNGSKKFAPMLRSLAQTYASCIEAPCMRLFFALAAALGMHVVYADTTNAYQQSPGPTTPCFLRIDDAYASWYAKKFPDAPPLDRKNLVIPVKKALQGHPEAGRLWETMISGILDDLGFKSTTQERNIYRGTIDGDLVLVCRQVDDFAIASANSASAEKLVQQINAHVTTESQGMGEITVSGTYNRYNGLDVRQTRDYIKLSCDNYIDRVLQTRGWETPAQHESDRHDEVPMSTAVQDQILKSDPGPEEGSALHKQLEEQQGFSYRQVLGELVYAYTLCRPDIGYAVTTLSRFSQAPNEHHYGALKRIAKYLRSTKDWGLIYWRDKPLESFPSVPLPDIPSGLTLNETNFPRSDLLELVCFVDAAHATCPTTRRSVTGFVHCIAGAAVAYKSKMQTCVATSSTEAEFYAAVHAAKVAKYLRSILKELGFEQHNPTVLHIDNEAAINMINENRPTQRSRHIDIQWFAIQEWRQEQSIITRHIPGTLNPSDDQTKALGSTLHHRHARRSMGHFGRPDTSS